MKSLIRLDGRPYNIIPEQYRIGLSQQMANKTSSGNSRYADSSHFDHHVKTDFSGGLGDVAEDGNGAWFLIGNNVHSNVMTVAPSIRKGVVAETDFEACDHFAMTGSVVIGSGANADYERLAVGVTDNRVDVRECVVYLRAKTPPVDTTITFAIYGYEENFMAPVGTPIRTHQTILRADSPPGFQNFSTRISWHGTNPPASGSHVCAVLTCQTTFEIATTNPDAYLIGSYYDGGAWVSARDMPYLGGGTAAYAYDYMNGFWPRYSDSLSTPTYAGMLGEGGGLYYASMGGLWETDSPTPDHVPAGVTERATGAVQGQDNIYVAYGSSHNAYRFERSTELWHDLSINADLFEIGGGFLWCSDGTKIRYTGVVHPDPTPDVGLPMGDWTEIDAGESIFDIRFHSDFLYYITRSGMFYVGYGDEIRPAFRAPITQGARLYAWQDKLYLVDEGEMLEWNAGAIRNISPISVDGGLPKYADGTIDLVFSTNYYLYACIQAKKNYGKSGLYCWNGRGWTCMYLFGNHVRFSDAKVYYSENLVSEIPGITRIMLITSEGYCWLNMHERAQIPYVDDQNISPSSHPMWVELPWVYGGLINYIKDWESVAVTYDMQVQIPEAQWRTSIYYKVKSGDPWVLLGEHEFYGEAGMYEVRWSDNATRPNTERIKVGILHQPINTNQEEQQVPRLAAINIKYHAMTDNTWQWNLAIPLEEGQMLIDGTDNPYNYDEMSDHLKRVARRDKKPVQFVDVDGREYIVKILQGSGNLARLSRTRSETEYAMVWSVSLLHLVDDDNAGD